MIVATAGHVDHGKTLLVKALTGVDTDRLPEEKRRGLTIEPGFAYVHLPGGQVLGFVDVPGHERFIRNMLAGVAAIDFALLVIAADDGPMPQTREHLDILDLLGVGDGAVAVTKADLVDQARLEQVMDQSAVLLKHTTLAGAPLFPLSAVTGVGVEALDRHLAAAAASHRAGHSRGRFRFSVDRCFTLDGIGLVVTGAVVAGRARRDDTLMLSPPGLAVRLRGIRAHDREAPEAVAGQRCALNIAGRGLHRRAVQRGDWIVDAALHVPVTRLDVRLRLLRREAKALKTGTPVHIHLGAAETTGRVHTLEGKSLAPGDEALVQLVLDRPLDALARDRLVLRDKSARRTMAGGLVVDPFAAARGRTRPERLAQLKAMDCDDPGEALAGLLGRPGDGVNLDRFAQAWNLEAGRVEALLADQDAITFEVDSGRFVLATGRWNEAREAIIARLERWHAQHPDDLGAGERDLAATIRAPALRAAVLRALVADGQVVLRHGAYGLASHQPVMAEADAAFWDQARPLLCTGELRPPTLHALAAALDLEVGELRRRLGRLARWRLVEQVADNRFFAADQLRRLEALAAEAAVLAGGGGFTAGAFRNLSGIGRNLTIEVLEYFDRAGVTSRGGEGRRTIRSSSTPPVK